ncbi:MAG: hypothetical protein IPN69_01850 [Acidobacteria bacterium]|nr:hypothetical protein [Acidobacteriota bacterium]
MKRHLPVLLLIVCVLASAAQVFALPAKIDSGYILLGGTSYDTPDYQTYLRFDLFARTGMPRREYRMFAEQPYSVYLSFPSRPQGKFDYRLVMPYAPQRLTINGELLSPVWYGDSEWKIQSDLTTPIGTVNSPPTVVLSAPFSMSGSSMLLGAYNIGFKTVGRGTLQVRFENLGGKYYMREAQYSFGDAPPGEMLSK